MSRDYKFKFFCYSIFGMLSIFVVLNFSWKLAIYTQITLLGIIFILRFFLKHSKPIDLVYQIIFIIIAIFIFYDTQDRAYYEKIIYTIIICITTILSISVNYFEYKKNNNKKL